MSEITDSRALTSRFQDNICSGGIYLALGREIHGAAVVVCYVRYGMTEIRLDFNRSLIGDAGNTWKTTSRTLSYPAGLGTGAAISSGQLGSSPATKSRVGHPSEANVPKRYAEPDTHFDP